MNGYGIEKDYQKSMEWFLKTAEKGHLMSQVNIGKYSLIY